MQNIHRVVARFDDPAEARDAMVDLELKGIDAEATHLVPPALSAPPKELALDREVDIADTFVRRGLKGGLLGALIGAAAVVGALALMRVEPFGSAVRIGAVGGIVGGFFIGAYWGAVVRLPVNEEAFDTFVLPTTTHGIVVEVNIDDPLTEADAVAVLRRHHAQQIEREVA
jgi:hypothetical protein